MSIQHWPELLAGFATGVALTLVVKAMFTKVHGKLLIDRTDPETDVYRFAIDDDVLESLHKQKRIVLVVDPNADLSEV